MNVMGPFIGIHGFQIHHVAHNVVFVRNAVSAVHIPGCADNVEGLATAVSLDNGNHLWRGEARINQTAYA